MGVPQLMEGAGPGPGDKDPQAAWELSSADTQTGRSIPYPPPPNPQIHSSSDLSVGMGWRQETETSWAFGGAEETLKEKPPGHCLHPCTGSCSYIPKPSPELRESLCPPHCPKAAWGDHPTPHCPSNGAATGLQGGGAFEGVAAHCVGWEKRR